jgi:glycosyltransferase involved in cell wall biosynthesis
MKILLVSEYFYPVSNGGTEQYVYYLAKGLIELKHEVVVISIHPELKFNNYKGIPVYYINAYLGTHSEIIKGTTPPENLMDFKEKVAYLSPDIIHFHTFTTNISTFHMKVAQQSCAKVLFTSHIPDHLCLSGGLIQNSSIVCNGKVEYFKCSFCYACSKNNHWSIKALKLCKYLLPAATNPVAIKKRDLNLINLYCDQIVMVAEWQKKYWELNISPEKPLLICRQGVNLPDTVNPKVYDNKNLKIGFVGRISAIKGLHLLFDAVKLLNNPKLEIYVAAIPSEAEIDYYNTLKANQHNLNIIWQENLNAQELAVFYQKIDYLTIPSLWLETGPFVAYEALSYKTPVIASNIGGMKELIIDGVNGFLFQPDANHLAEIIKMILDKRPAFNLDKKEVRGLERISEEMNIIYKDLFFSERD